MEYKRLVALRGATRPRTGRDRSLVADPRLEDWLD